MMSIDTIQAVSIMLPYEVRHTIYEFATGSQNFRQHKYLFDYVLKELQMRLVHTRASEEKIIELDLMVTQLFAMGAIKSIERFKLDAGRFDRTNIGQPFIAAFATAHLSITFRLIWAKEICGPTNIIVYNNVLGKWEFMTPNYFTPTAAELVRMRRPSAKCTRMHSDTLTLLADILAETQ